MLNFYKYPGDSCFQILNDLEAMNYGLEEDKKYLTLYGKINVYVDLVGGEIFYHLVQPSCIKIKIERSTFTYKIRNFYDKSILFTTKEGFEDFVEQNKEKFKNPSLFKMIERVKYKDKFCIYDKI